MSSHRRRVKHFSRKSGPRKALLKGMVESLMEHGRIATTVDRAKEVRRHAEKAITLGKKGDLATRRLLLARYPNKDVVESIITDISPRFKTRPGGYTRIIKIGRRPGDTAEMAFLEFVDYDYTLHGTDKVTKASKKAGKADKAADKAELKEVAKAKKAKTRLVAAKAKAVKTMQKQSRIVARG
jgi:large subunit ribosomal protein L17